jgi:hypothetical protein
MEKYYESIIIQNGKIVPISKLLLNIPIHVSPKGKGGSEYNGTEENSFTSPFNLQKNENDIGEQENISMMDNLPSKHEPQGEILSPGRGPGKPPEKNLSMLSGQDYTFDGDLHHSTRLTEIDDWNSAVIQDPNEITSSLKFLDQKSWIGENNQDTSDIKFKQYPIGPEIQNFTSIRKFESERNTFERKEEKEENLMNFPDIQVDMSLRKKPQDLSKGSWNVPIINNKEKKKMKADC